MTKKNIIIKKQAHNRNWIELYIYYYESMGFVLQEVRELKWWEKILNPSCSYQVTMKGSHD